MRAARRSPRAAAVEDTGGLNPGAPVPVPPQTVLFAQTAEHWLH